MGKKSLRISTLLKKLMKKRGLMRNNELQQANTERSIVQKKKDEEAQAIAVGRSAREGLRFSTGIANEPMTMHSVDHDEEDESSVMMPDKKLIEDSGASAIK